MEEGLLFHCHFIHRLLYYKKHRWQPVNHKTFWVYTKNYGLIKLDRKRILGFKVMMESQLRKTNPRSTDMIPIIKATAYLSIANLPKSQSSVKDKSLTPNDFNNRSLHITFWKEVVFLSININLYPPEFHLITADSCPAIQRDETAQIKQLSSSLFGKSSPLRYKSKRCTHV